MNWSVGSDDPIIIAGIPVFAILASFLCFMFMTAVLSLGRRRTEYAPFTPGVSIVIPAFNEEESLPECLEAIVRNGYPQDRLEVIVVDDGSTDRTREAAELFARTHEDLRCRVLAGAHLGKSSALNQGIAETGEEFVLTVDADVVLGPNVIANLVAPLQDPSVGATTVLTGLKDRRTLLEEFQMLEYALNSLIRVSFSRLFGNSIWFVGAVACYRRTALEAIGFFSRDTLAEDMDACLALFRNRQRIVTVGEAVVRTDPCPAVRSLFRQRMRWFYGALQALWKHRSVMRRSSPEVIFLFFNEVWWTLYSFVFLPLLIYQVNHWLPETPTEVGWYLFRWFSAVGPWYVLYKLPEWGLTLTSIFGMVSGMVALAMSIMALSVARERLSWRTPLVFFFYFPYTILINVIRATGVVHYGALTDVRYFVK